MKTSLLTLLIGLMSTASSLLVAAPTVSGPDGLSLTEVSPTEPFFAHFLTNNRLNLRLYLTNDTGQFLTYQQGSVVFRNAAGGVLLTAPLSPAEFMWRSKFYDPQDNDGGLSE